MKPMVQKIIDDKNGDCFAACLASILELEEVPCFHSTEHTYWADEYNKWLVQFNLQIVAIGKNVPPKGYSILTVESALYEGLRHSVVYHSPKGWSDGCVAWNPNPQDKRGTEIPVEQYCYWHILAVVNPVLCVQYMSALK